MTRSPATPRPGFTLVELLVAMGIIVLLAAIAVAVVPEALSRDRTTDGATTVRQILTIAKARALRDNLPTGVRFLTGTDPGNLAKTDGRWATEVQYVQQPPPLVPSRGEELDLFFETVVAPATPAGALVTLPTPLYPAGTIKPPTVHYKNTTLPPPTQDTPLLAFIKANANATRPVELRFFRGDELITLQVTAATLLTNPSPRVGQYQLAVVNPPPPAATEPTQAYDVLANALGGAMTLSVGGFWVSLPAQPLLGEQPIQLPRNVAIDLGVSSPSGPATADYDILFAPNGQVLLRGEGQINLWVRDYTKPGGASYDFANGGEQQVVALKTKSGAIGTFPINHDQTDPFKFAKAAAAAP